MTATARLPRVLTVIPQSDGAGFVFARQQADALRELGVEIETFFLSTRHSPRALLRERRRLRDALRRFNADVVHAHYGTIAAFLTVTATRLPVVITFHGSDLNPIPSLPAWRVVAGRLLSQLSVLRAARVICVSDALKRRLWWRARIATVIPMGVDLTGFTPGSRAEARDALRWPADDRVVLFNAGSSPRVKRLDLAEQAVSAATALIGPIRMAITDGTVPPDRIPTLMNAADCLLVTSDFEGSPMVVKEAMASNLPVISVDAGDAWERLQGVEPSYLVQRDPGELGRAVAKALVDRRRSNGRLAMQQLSSRIIAERVLALLTAAAHGHAD